MYTRILIPFSKKYRLVSKTYVTKMHLFYFKDQSDFAMKTHLQVHKVSHFFTMYLLIMMFIGIFLFNVTPLYNNFSSGVFKANKSEDLLYEHSIYYALPFDYENDFDGYIIMFTLNWYVSYYASTAFCSFDLYLSLMVFTIWGHLKILNHNLKTFPRPEHEEKQNSTTSTINSIMFTEEEMLWVVKKLKTHIDYHRQIMEFTDEISAAFGPMLLIYLTFFQVSGCLLLLECSQMDPKALARYGPLTLILFQQLIQLSMVFELIGSTSEKLINSVYCIPWECMDSKNRMIVESMLRKVQTPIHFKALGVADVGVQTMTMILKTSFSYFTFLRTVAE